VADVFNTPKHPRNLEEAICSGSVEAVRERIEKGDDLNWASAAPDSQASACGFTDHWTPLHRAVIAKSEAIVRLLIERGANVNCARGDGKTPLHLAAESGEFGIAKLLIENGADVNVLAQLNWSALTHYYTFITNEFEGRQMDSDATDLKRRIRDFSTPLTLAERHGHAAIRQLLIANGAEGGCDEAARKADKAYEDFRLELPDALATARSRLVSSNGITWKERDVPLRARGVRYSWLRDFAQEVGAARSLGPYMTADFVEQIVKPLTRDIKAPLYALVPAGHRGDPDIFLSHVWANLLSAGAYSTLGSVGEMLAWGRDVDPVIWIDVVCYNQHLFENVAGDMAGIIANCKSLVVALTTEPFFHRTWCLWEILCGYRGPIPIRICDMNLRTRKFFSSEIDNKHEDFVSINKARTTLAVDRENLLSEMVRSFGSIKVADDALRTILEDRAFVPGRPLMPDQETIRGYTDLLQSAGTDRKKLDAVLVKLQTEVTSLGIRAIAAQYSGGDFATQDYAIEAIIQRYNERCRSEKKAEIVTPITLIESVISAAREWERHGRDPQWLKHTGQTLQEIDRLSERWDLPVRIKGGFDAIEIWYLAACRSADQAAKRSWLSRFFGREP
jgi:Ankyrin repeats (3 copies)